MARIARAHIRPDNEMDRIEYKDIAEAIARLKMGPDQSNRQVVRPVDDDT